MELYTNPPPEATVVCVDELGPVSPRTFPPAPEWSPDGHRITKRLWNIVEAQTRYGSLALSASRGRQVSLTFISRSRNSKGYLKLLKKVERAIPRRLIYLIADNLKIHDRAPW